MTLRQLLYFNEVIQQNFNISAAAKALYTAQPGVTRQLQDLALELGVDLFRYQGKRLVGLTEAGAEIAAGATEVIRAVGRIESIAQAYAAGQRNDLVIVVSRYAAGHQLRDAMIRVHERLPGLRVQVYEEDPQSACAMLRAGDAQIGVLTEMADCSPDLLYFPIEQWRLILVIPRDHPIGLLSQPGLEVIAGYPVCSYERSSTSRQRVEQAFKQAGLESPVTYSLSSSMEILDYVESRIGIGIVAESAFIPSRHPDLQGIDISHLLCALTTNLVIQRKAHLSKPVCELARLLDPALTRVRIEEAQAA